MEERGKGKSPRGFAAMDAEKQKQIASKGGKAAHAKGTAHEFTPEEAREAGRKGGEAVVEEYGHEHMAQIGRKGGETVSENRAHMAEIGRKGGEKRGLQRKRLKEEAREERQEEKVYEEQEQPSGGFYHVEEHGEPA